MVFDCSQTRQAQDNFMFCLEVVSWGLNVLFYSTFGYWIKNASPLESSMRNVKLKMSIKWCLEIWKNVCDYYSSSSRWRQSSLSNQLVMFVCKDPGISTTATPGTYAPFDDGIKRNIFIKNATGDVLIGEVRLHYLFLRAVHHVSSHWRLLVSSLIQICGCRFGRARPPFPTSPTLRHCTGGRTAFETFIPKFQ